MEQRQNVEETTQASAGRPQNEENQREQVAEGDNVISENIEDNEEGTVKE